MQHSHEALDRPGGFSRSGLLAPLRRRDFRLLWSGQAASLLGDGVFTVAMAWQVYALSNAPTALSVVGIAMTVPTIVLLLVGGVVTDRVDRRRVLIGADVVRGLTVAALAVLALTGALELWQMIVLVAVYGAGSAFFSPAFEAIVPDLLPATELAQANALDQVVRPIAFRLIGPALGGWLIASLGSGTAFALDAATFAASTLAVALVRPRPRAVAGEPLLRDLRQGLAFVRAQVWLWGTLASAAVAYLVFMGPAEVLLPYLVKNGLHGSAGDLGLVLAGGGVGAVAAAIATGLRGYPRRPMTMIYVVWTLATLALAGYGLAHAAWQLVLACLVFNALETAGTVVWATTKQRRVPGALLGRVSSLDWLISIGLLPLSLALTGPVSAALGVRATLVGAGVVGAAVTLAALFLPGMREGEGATAAGNEAAPVPLPQAAEPARELPALPRAA